MLWSSLVSNTGVTEGPLSAPVEGLQVGQAVYAYNRQRANNMIFVRYALTNTGPDLTDAYVGFHSDTDLDDHDRFRYNDNAVGYDIERGLTYTYPKCSPENAATCYSAVTGFTFLETPGNIGVTSHRILFRNAQESPFGEITLDRSEQMYWALQGRSATGDPMIDPITQEPTAFAFPGDPVTGEGWLQEPARDVRSLIGGGPFTLRQGETVVVTVVWVVAGGNSLAESLESLKSQIDYIQTEPAPWQF